MKFEKILPLFLSLTPVAGFAAPEDWGPADTVACYNVGPGIEYTKIIYPDYPLIMWYTTIDLSNPYNKIENAMSRNQVPDIDRWDVETFYNENSRPGHRVKVAWNHDFFSYEEGIGIGANISNGQVACKLDGRSVLAITADKTAEVFNSFVDARVIAEDGTEETIDVYNNSSALGDPDRGDCSFFNTLNSRTLSGTGTYIKVRPQGEWIVNGDDIPCEVLEISDSPLQTSDTDCVIFLRKTSGEQHALDGHVEVGDIVKIHQGFTNVVWGHAPANILNAFHGYPSIAHDGVLHEGEYNNFENGREHENSAHVMAGISQDKTKLYICLNEMSADSKAIDCVDMATWMLAHGAWDIVNFDSGGSAAIVVGGEMLNVPGRGSVRPVVNAMLAVSVAPDDAVPTTLGFTKKRISPAVVSLTPLSVVSYNQYGDIVEEGVEGCTFAVVPETLGSVDSEGVFHASLEGGSGKIIAEKDGLKGEIDVIVRTVENIRPAYESLLIDDAHSCLIPLIGTLDGLDCELDPGALTWTVDNPAVAAIDDNGVLTGLANGTCVVTGTLDDLEMSIHVTVEIAKGKMAVYDFADMLNDSGNYTSTGLTNVTLQQGLPEGWSEGAMFNVEKANGRVRNLKVTFNENVYGLPTGMELPIHNPDGAVSRYILAYKDNLGNKYTYDVDVAAGDSMWAFDFANEDGSPFEVYQYPISLESVQLHFNTATNATFAVGDLNAIYPEGAGSVMQMADGNDLSVICAGESLTALFDAENEGVAYIAIYSSDGKKVSSVGIDVYSGSNEYRCDTVWLSDGIYILVVNVDGRQMAHKFIKR